MTIDDLTRTGSRTGSGDRATAPPDDRPRLIVALEGARPSAPGLRLMLDGVDEVTIGRGPERAVRRDGTRVHVTLPDHELSRQHARVRRSAGGWELADLGSKNGTHLSGHLVQTGSLSDGDAIEVGAATVLFREDGAESAVADRDLAAEPATPPGFATLALDAERRARAVAKLATADVPILVHGETGTGKEVVARAIHDASGRTGELVAINCGALPRTLIESELFGYRRGAFSGATTDREGLIRRAHGGTLFLDEVAELPEESQATLLRVLQEREVRPVGGTDAVDVDVRVIAATHQDLPRRIADGRFRQDLYARLAGFELALTPLRERLEDLGTLIAALLPRVVPAGIDPRGVRIHRSASRLLFGYGYPLNVRELEQALRTALVLCGGTEIRAEHLPEVMRQAAARAVAALRPEDRALRERVIEVLRQTGGNVMAAARQLDKAPVQVRRWCQRLGIDVGEFRRG